MGVKQRDWALASEILARTNCLLSLGLQVATLPQLRQGVLSKCQQCPTTDGALEVKLSTRCEGAITPSKSKARKERQPTGSQSELNRDVHLRVSSCRVW